MKHPLFTCLGLVMTAPVSAIADIELAATAPEWLALAAEDLSRDHERVTGLRWNVERFWRASRPTGTGPRVVVGSIANESFSAWLNQSDPARHKWLDGKSEAFSAAAHPSEPGTFVIAGSDDRGAMRGIYAVSSEVLGIDPTHLWTGIEPHRKEKIDWTTVSARADEPTFRHRGWFINDEDLLTGWMSGGGRRYIDYPHYETTVDPEAMAMVCETAVRLGFNLIIPASFLDIENPHERRLVDEASRRGLAVSMHHIEPLGVNAFAYFNYWRERGEQPMFSFHSAADKLKQTWRHYAGLWSRHPDVVWQLGLRGIGDRPMWMADPGTPQSDAERGAIISNAIAFQRELVIGLTGNPKPAFTTTLWAEGAALFSAGHLKIPSDVLIVFADNSAGRVWQSDFYDVARKPDRDYGVYFHHQLWGSGPHLVQGVSPLHQERLFKAAFRRDSSDYAILNVSNIREFVLGLNASSRTVLDTPAFDADRFLEQQCTRWFGDAGPAAADAYRTFFDAYLENDRGVPYFLDGLLRSRGSQLVGAIDHFLENGELPAKKETETSRWAGAHLADMHPPLPEFGQATAMLEKQRDGLARAWDKIQLAEARIRHSCDASRLRFFRENLTAQWFILNGLTEWALGLERAMASLRAGDRPAAAAFGEQALIAWQQIELGKSIVTANPRWRTWYDGDTKMNLPRTEKAANDCVGRLAKQVIR